MVAEQGRTNQASEACAYTKSEAKPVAGSAAHPILNLEHLKESVEHVLYEFLAGKE